MTNYKNAGVDIEAGNAFIKKIKPFVQSTWDKNVHTDLKNFAAMYKNGRGKYLVASTDGVGTKLKIAQYMDKHDTVGIDLVAMCANDIITIGAKPLFFLQYLACGSIKYNQKALEDAVKGTAKGCKIAECSYIGGETAEMLGVYDIHEYDLAGFVVGEVHGKEIIDGSKIKKGDKVLGLESSGLHSNGYSLVRDLFFVRWSMNVHEPISELGCTLGEELLKPTKIYVKEIKSVRKKVKGIANITGGGFIDNIPRVMPRGLGVEIKKGSWPVHKIFTYMQDRGDVEEKEMYRTFNMGIGMVLIVDKKFKNSDIKKIEDLGTKVYEIGKVVEKEGISFV